MVEKARRYDYAQTVIGDCGHACGVWPQITDLMGRNPRIICDECTRDEYGIDPEEPMFVWVRIRKDPKPKKQTAPRKPKPPKPMSVLENILRQEGLF